MEVAKINDYIITEKEFLAKVNYLMKVEHLSEPTEELKKKALWSLIDGILLLQQAEKSNVTATQEEVANMMVDHMMEYDSKEEYEKMLEKSGFTTDKFEQHIQKKVKIKKFVKSNFSFSKIEIPEEKLKKFYDDNIESFYLDETIRVSHILIDNKGGDAKKRAKEIRNLINSPKEFKAIANVVSTCPSNSKSGDLGFITKGKMFDEFDKIAFSLDINEISQPLESVFGFHIIMVTDKKQAHYVSFEKMKSPLTKRLKAIEAELKLMNFLKELRASTGIIINEDSLN